MDFFKNAIEIKDMFLTETVATIYMVSVTMLISYILGLIIGILLTLTETGGLIEKPHLYSFLDKMVNIGRSIPFVILLALIAPITRFIVGTNIGNTAAIVPLTFGTTPFFARQVQNALAEVDKGVIEAAQAMGFNSFDIVMDVYLPEAKEGLLRATAVTIISLIGLTAMAGAIGAGGLGKVAISYGYNRQRSDVILVATVIILLLVFIVQAVFDIWIKSLKRK